MIYIFTVIDSYRKKTKKNNNTGVGGNGSHSSGSKFKNVFALMYVSTGSLSLSYNSRTAYQGYKHLMLYKQSHPHHSDVISYRCTVFISDALSATAVLSFECYFNTL